MNREEMIEQLESLIETWQLKEADLNQTDIDAIKYLLEENKELKQWYEIKDARLTKQRAINEKLLEENKQLRQLNKIIYVDKAGNILDKLEKWLEEEKSIVYRDCGHTQRAYQRFYDKLKELKGE